MKIGKPDPDALKAALGPVANNERVADGGAKTKPRGDGGDAAAVAGAAPGATVALSASAAALAAAAAEAPQFDAEKVERIAQQIRDGRYQVNAEAIADKLIANAQEVLSRAKR